jgi:hypothetical protein
MKGDKMKRALSIILVVSAAVLGAIAVSQAASTSRHLARRAHFSVLRSANAAASTAAAALPASTAKYVTEPGTLAAEYEIEPAGAAYVEINATTHAWVIPGRKGMCLVVPVWKGLSIDTSCGSTANAAGGSLVMILQPSSGPVVYGLVPDGASVTVTNNDGTSKNVPVAHNVFLYAGLSARAVTVHPQGGEGFTTPIKQGGTTTPFKPEGQ